MCKGRKLKFIQLSHVRKYFLVLPAQVVCVNGMGLGEVSFNSKISGSEM